VTLTLPCAAGCDYSNHAIHLALVNRAGIVTYDALLLKHVGDQKLAQLLSTVLAHYRELGAEHIVIERPYLGRYRSKDGLTETTNPLTLIDLADLAGQVRALASLAGFQVHRMTASEWRPLAGVTRFVEQGLNQTGRDALKEAAIKQVKLEYGFSTKDNNLAEALLMAGVALGLAKREQLVERAR